MMTINTFWQFMMPYVAMVMIPFVAVIIAALKVVLDKLTRLSSTLERVDETSKATKAQTDGIISRMQDTIAKKDVDAAHLAEVTDLKTDIAAAKASDREEPK
jgi:uncharacterized protein YoxC